ncbi:MAG: hypothetical protein HY231_23970 [Acidobacteria bacterium]|nr:hypothetical protein [Acidobacteriota bacterium]
MKQKIEQIVVYVRTVAQHNPKTTKTVLLGATAYLIARFGLHLSADVQTMIVMAILTWLGINAGDAKPNTQEALSVTTTTTQQVAPATLAEAITALKESAVSEPNGAEAINKYFRIYTGSRVEILALLPSRKGERVGWCWQENGEWKFQPNHCDEVFTVREDELREMC